MLPINDYIKDAIKACTEKIIEGKQEWDIEYLKHINQAMQYLLKAEEILREHEY